MGNFKNPVEGPLLEGFRIECIQYFFSIDPIRSLRHALVLCELVAQQCLDKRTRTSSTALVLSEDPCKTEMIIIFLYGKDCSDRKRYILVLNTRSLIALESTKKKQPN